MRVIALAIIRFYQRYLSAYKGFSCAYRTHTGRSSCSVLGYRAIRAYGVWHGLGILRKRTHLCGVVHRRHRMLPRLALAKQRGMCDVGCDLPCDGGDCDLPKSFRFSNLLNGLSCLDMCDACSLLWPNDNHKAKNQKSSQPDREQAMYIPPKRHRHSRS